MKETRIYGSKVDMDREKVKKFWNGRLIKDQPLASVILRQNDDDQAKERNEREKNYLSRLVGGRHKLKILDIGCGLGRWVENFGERIERYHGIDGTETFISAAREKFIHSDKISFICEDAAEFTAPDFQPNLIIVNGLCMYLNDADMKALMQKVGDEILKESCNFYLRESVSVMKERLTLNDFYSNELKTEYHAIYRTIPEYDMVISEALPNAIVAECGLMNNDASIWRQSETKQYYWWISGDVHR